MKLRTALIFLFLLGLPAIATVIIYLRISSPSSERQPTSAQSAAQEVAELSVGVPVVAPARDPLYGHSANRDGTLSPREVPMLAEVAGNEEAQPQRDGEAVVNAFSSRSASHSPRSSRERKMQSDVLMPSSPAPRANQVNTDEPREPEILTDYRTFAAAAGAVDEVATNVYALYDGAVVAQGPLWFTAESADLSTRQDGSISALEFLDGVAVDGPDMKIRSYTETSFVFHEAE